MLKDGRYRYLCYRSAQIPDDPSFCDYRMALNFVFPPKTCKPNGYADELSNMFTLTDPVSFELAVALGDDTNLKSDPAEKCNTLFIEGQEVCDLRDIHIASVKGKRHVYCATDFGKAEIRSASFPFAHLESCD